ncbi:MAG: hypothetical protein KDB27_25890, partial [Planctomycetales bacterium]|nr:hypothetical protein [Planctomycetales bacterium]
TSDKPQSEGRFQSAKKFFSKLRGRKPEEVSASTIAPVQFVEKVDDKNNAPKSRSSKTWWK